MAKLKAFRKPITPNILVQKGVIDSEYSILDKIDSAPCVEYILWGTPGKGSNLQGFLKIKKESLNAQANIFQVIQVIRNHTERIHRIDVAYICQSSAPFSLKKWKLIDRHFDVDGSIIKGLSREEHGFMDGNDMKISTGSVQYKRTVSTPVVPNWTVFDLTSKLKFNDEAIFSFSMLEDIGLVKPGQKIVYGGQEGFPFEESEFKLHRFYQTGFGILPMEYWLDENRCLISVISNGRAYLRKEIVTGQLNSHLQVHYLHKSECKVNL